MWLPVHAGIDIADQLAKLETCLNSSKKYFWAYVKKVCGSAEFGNRNQS